MWWDEQVGREPKTDSGELAVELFAFVREQERLRARFGPTVADLITSGQGFWFHELPAHDSIADLRGGDVGPILGLKRPPTLLAPSVPSDLQAWLEGPFDRPEWEPRVRSEILVGSSDGGVVSFDELELILLKDRPDVQDTATRWLARWQAWAREDLRYRPIRSFYSFVEEMVNKAAAAPRDIELILALGCVGFLDDRRRRVNHHVVTVPLDFSLDSESGDLTLSLGRGEPVLDVDSLPSRALPAADQLAKIAHAIRTSPDRPSDLGSFGPLIRSFVYQLGGDASFVDSDQPPEPGGGLSVAWAPAVVIRKRDSRCHPSALQDIVSQLKAGASPPEAILPDFEASPDLDPDQDDLGSILDYETDSLTTARTTERQRQALRHAAASSPTVILGERSNRAESVQTASLIVEQLLALGKRVLITGDSPEGLREIQSALAVPIRPMVLAVESYAERTQHLDGVFAAIDKFGGLYSPDEAKSEEQQLLGDVELLRLQLEEQKKAQVLLREFETRQHEVHGVVGTLPRIIEWHAEQAVNYAWLELVPAARHEPCPLSNEDFKRWLRLLRNDLSADDVAGMANINPAVGLDGVLSSAEFAEIVRLTSQPVGAGGEANLDHAIVDMGSNERRRRIGALRQSLDSIALGVQTLAAEIDEGIIDVESPSFNAWTARQSRLAIAVGQIHGSISRWGHMPVELSIGIDEAVASATALLDYTRRGRAIKLGDDGYPRIGLRTPKIVKDNMTFFHSVSVDSKPPVTTELLTAFLDGAAAWRLLDVVDNCWPAGTPISRGATVSDRLAWHDGELASLNRVLDSVGEIQRQYRDLTDAGLPTGNAWKTRSDVERFVAELERVHDLYNRAEAEIELSLLAERVGRLEGESQNRIWASPLLVAIQDRDPQRYGTALERRLGMVKWDAQMNWLGDVRSRVRPYAPSVVNAVESSPTDPAWDDRADEFVEAWRWAAVGLWLADNRVVDLTKTSKRIDFIEDQLRRTVGQIANLRAWRHALERRLASETESDHRTAPAWMTPLESVPDLVGLEQNLFDAIVVDGASQIGLHGLFLHFLAPKLVVIGDMTGPASESDALTSGIPEPAGSGMLPWGLYGHWKKAGANLFDDSAIRFDNVISLGEQRAPAPLTVGFRRARGERPRLLMRPVSDSVLVKPFRSLFGQRVSNFLLEQGFMIEPRFEFGQFQIDLLIHGSEATLAVELADDQWEGREQCWAQMESKRSLEAAGWIFHRISEADYVADPIQALGVLTRKLEAMNIKPGADLDSSIDAGSGEDVIDLRQRDHPDLFESKITDFRSELEDEALTPSDDRDGIVFDDFAELQQSSISEELSAAGKLVWAQL